MAVTLLSVCQDRELVLLTESPHIVGPELVGGRVQDDREGLDWNRRWFLRAAVGGPMEFETLKVRREGGVLFADIAAPPMNLLGTELIRDLVSLIQRAEADDAVQVLVFTSADPDSTG